MKRARKRSARVEAEEIAEDVEAEGGGVVEAVATAGKTLSLRSLAED
jgi:hypothetical protein